MTKDFTRALSEFVLGTPVSAVPEAALASVGTALVDTVGCALAGNGDEAVRIALERSRWIGAIPRSTIWGCGLRSDPGEAAFVNGIAAHVLDLDDSLPGLRGHPSGPIVAAALAVAETVETDGRSLLAAIAIAVEVTGKLGMVFGHEHYFFGWHTTSTAGAFAATAVAARLSGATVDELCMAWGIAASTASGLRRNFGTMTKPFHVGHAARAGVEAAWLARQGFTASPSVFEGLYSVFEVFGKQDGKAPCDALLMLGAPWSVLDPGLSVKRWPCCFGTHRALGGVLRLVEENGITADEVERIRVGFLPNTDKALLYSDPQTGREAKFSIEYCVAAAVLDGVISFGTFDDGNVRRPEARDLQRRVERYTIPAEGIFTAHHGYNDLEIVTTSGTYSMRAESTPGSLGWPLTPEELHEKFRSCAQVVMDAPEAEAAYERLKDIAGSADAGAVVREVLA